MNKYAYTPTYSTGKGEQDYETSGEEGNNQTDQADCTETYQNEAEKNCLVVVIVLI